MGLLAAPKRDDPRIVQRFGRCKNWHGYRGDQMMTDCMFTFGEATNWMKRGAPDEIF